MLHNSPTLLLRGVYRDFLNCFTFGNKLVCIDVLSEVFELMSICTFICDGLFERTAWWGLSWFAVNRESKLESLDKIFELAANLQAQGEHFGKFIIILSGSIVKDDRPNFLNGLERILLALSFFSIESWLFPLSLHVFSKLLLANLLLLLLHENFFVDSADFSLWACDSCSSDLLPFTITSLLKILVQQCFLLFFVHSESKTDSILLYLNWFIGDFLSILNWLWILLQSEILLLLSLGILENDDSDFSPIAYCRQSSTCMSTKVVWDICVSAFLLWLWPNEFFKVLWTIFFWFLPNGFFIFFGKEICFFATWLIWFNRKLWQIEVLPNIVLLCLLSWTSVTISSSFILFSSCCIALFELLSKLESSSSEHVSFKESL